MFMSLRLAGIMSVKLACMESSALLGMLGMLGRPCRMGTFRTNTLGHWKDCSFLCPSTQIVHCLRHPRIAYFWTMSSYRPPTDNINARQTSKWNSNELSSDPIVSSGLDVMVHKKKRGADVQSHTENESLTEQSPADDEMNLENENTSTQSGVKRMKFLHPAIPSSQTTLASNVPFTQLIRNKPELVIARSRRVLMRPWRRPGWPVQGDYLALMKSIVDLEQIIVPVRGGSIIQHHLDKMQKKTNELSRKEVLGNFIDEQTWFLCQIDEGVIDGLIAGDLPSRWLKKMPNIRQWARKYEGNPKSPTLIPDVPYIYINYIVQKNDSSGVDIKDALNACHVIECLCQKDLNEEGQDLLKKLNNKWIEKRVATSMKDVDLFTAKHPTAKGTSADSRRHFIPFMEQWVKATRALIHSQKITEPLSLSEVGLSAARDYYRLNHHRNLSTSSTIMLLLVYCVLHVVRPNHYQMEQFIVAYPDSTFQLPLAESIITILTNSYIKTGGLNFAAAGWNSGRLDDKTTAQWGEIYGKLLEYKIVQKQDQNVKRFSNLDELEKDINENNEKQREVDDEAIRHSKYLELCEMYELFSLEIEEMRTERERLEKESDELTPYKEKLNEDCVKELEVWRLLEKSDVLLTEFQQTLDEIRKKIMEL